MAARRKAAKKKAAKKRAPTRRAKKRALKPARKAAKKRAVKPARKAAKKRAPARRAKKRAVKPARKAAKKRTVKAVRGAAKQRIAPAAFAPQKAGASAKDLVLFEINRARVAVMAAIQGIGAGTAMRPVAEGKWSIHEIVLHLSVSDRLRLEEFDALLAGVPATWTSLSGTPAEAAMNEARLAQLREQSWDDAVRLLMTTRAELLERLQAVPAEPGDVWTTSHPFGAILRRLWEHDRHHADSIKNARIAG
jgi:uncharacterized damage-inducible protein DinB